MSNRIIRATRTISFSSEFYLDRRVEVSIDERGNYVLRNHDASEEERLRHAYIEQQRRMACPGCGEEPFLG